MLFINSVCWFFLSEWCPYQIEDVRVITAILWVLFTTLCVCDVASDGRMVKHVQTETESTLGNTQSGVWACRAFGRLGGGICITALLRRDGDDDETGRMSSRQFMNGFVVIPVLFCVPLLFFVQSSHRVNENSDIPHNSVAQMSLCQTFRKMEAVVIKHWRPVGFMVILCVLPDTGSNVYLYISESIEHNGLGFATPILGVVGIAHAVSCIIGAFLYRNCVRKFALRKVFVVTIIIGSIISLSQLILITGYYKQWDITPTAFVLTDDVVGAIIAEFLFLPVLIMMATLIPPGLETVLYAFFTSLSNVCGIISSFISAGVTESFNIKRNDTGAIDFTNLWKMTLLCGCLGLLPLMFIHWIPRKLQPNIHYQECVPESESESESDSESDSDEAGRVIKDLEMTLDAISDSDRSTV